MKRNSLLLVTFAVALGISSAQTPVAPQQPNTPQQGTPQQNLPQTPNPNDPTRPTDPTDPHQGMPKGRTMPDANSDGRMTTDPNGKMDSKTKTKKNKKGMTDPAHPDAAHPDSTSPSKP